MQDTVSICDFLRMEEMNNGGKKAYKKTMNIASLN
jgi:hypothetical protein